LRRSSPGIVAASASAEANKPVTMANKKPKQLHASAQENPFLIIPFRRAALIAARCFNTIIDQLLTPSQATG
jgi:hypothetical protein